MLLFITCKELHAKTGLQNIEQNEGVPYQSLFVRYGEQYHIDWQLLAAIAFVESRYSASAFNKTARVFSRGLLQLTFASARGCGFRGAKEDLFNLDTNLTYGCKLLVSLKTRFGTLRDVISAYNCGKPGRSFAYVEKVYGRYTLLAKKKISPACPTIWTVGEKIIGGFYTYTCVQNCPEDRNKYYFKTIIIRD